MSRKWPLGLTLFSSTALAIVIAVAIIPIPSNLAVASQFSNPLAVSSYANDAVSRHVQTYVKYVPVIGTPTMRGGKVVWADLFVDVRTNKQVRVAPGDMIPVKFADGSTMQVAYGGLTGGYYFRAVYNSLRAPGVPMYQPTDSTKLWLIGSDTSGGSGFVDMGGGTSITVVSGGGASCITGSVGLCDRPPQLAAF